MIRTLCYLLAILYCFVWLRIPDIGGVAFPVQRLVAWAGLVVILARLALKGGIPVGSTARSFLRLAMLFMAFLLVNLAQKLAYGSHFHLLYFLMDFSKYAAVFTVAFLIYYGLSSRLASEDRLVDHILLSATGSIVLLGIFLALYSVGFRTENVLLAPSFGGALGVWPTGEGLPRLAGTAAEPQQLSVLLVTPLLLMLSRDKIRRYWLVAAAGLLAILLSQSKFALVSAAFVLLHLFLVYPKKRKLLLAGLLPIAPLVVISLRKLPTFAATLSEGLGATAFVERLENLLLLLQVIQQYAFFGIGPGQYGIFRGLTLHGNESYAPTYYPNMDFLKVFAETGLAGFFLMLLLLGSLVWLFLRTYRLIPIGKRDRYLAVLLGALAILLNMAIGYELLHVFFWINVGVLIYFTDSVQARRQIAV
jgi:O-antigen ligase